MRDLLSDLRALPRAVALVGVVLATTVAALVQLDAFDVALAGWGS